MSRWLQRRGAVTVVAIAIIVPVCVLMLVMPKRNTVQQTSPAGDGMPAIRLPALCRDSAVSVEAALRTRRSIREFQRDPLTLEQIGQLLWSAQGITHPEGKRAAPSAGALYPLEFYVAAVDVGGLATGIYKYLPREHQLLRVVEGDLRVQLASAALNQNWISGAPVIFLVSVVYGRSVGKYGERSQRYANMEAGHAAENLALQAVALGLGTTMVGAFDDREVQHLAKMPVEEQALYLIPTGKPR